MCEAPKVAFLTAQFGGDPFRRFAEEVSGNGSGCGRPEQRFGIAGEIGAERRVITHQKDDKDHANDGHRRGADPHNPGDP